ncbi:ROK family protein [Ulvibacterium sp.]|uniref:ROK family protein n=1 Tax=Ulvibacterium sp. TaxID=2665914 RepID=UPI002604EB92|nr:ROK family protein [Ulvibacterium sp.]
MKRTPTVIGIDIGGTKISAALFHHHGDLLHKEVQPLAEREGGEVIALIGTMIQSLMDYAKGRAYKVVAIGACVPGIYDAIKKTVWAPNIPDWNHIPLQDALKKYLGDQSINIVLESDRSCYILGEVWKGCAKDCADAIFIAVGTGIGAGILSGGRIINGSGGIAGAIGWMALEPPYDKKYDAWGNLEHYASGDGIARSAVELLEKKRTSTSLLDAIPTDQITAHHVFDAYEKQDLVAVEVIEKVIGYWGMALANLVSIFNPRKVIFGGGVFGPADQFLDRIVEEAKQWAQPLSIQEIQLETSALGGDAGLIGAGYLALTTLNDQVHDE